MTMPRHLVSVRVTKQGKFRKTHLGEINAPSEDQARLHLLHRCAPSGEYARKFPGATFDQFQVTQLYAKAVVSHDRVVPHEPQPSELLYSTTDPYETPLVMPAWARTVPALAKQIDDGYELRRAAGLPVDGSFPADWPGFAQPDWVRYGAPQSNLCTSSLIASRPVPRDHGATTSPIRAGTETEPPAAAETAHQPRSGRPKR